MHEKKSVFKQLTNILLLNLSYKVKQMNFEFMTFFYQRIHTQKRSVLIFIIINLINILIKTIK